MFTSARLTSLLDIWSERDWERRVCLFSHIWMLSVLLLSVRRSRRNMYCGSSKFDGYAVTYTKRFIYNHFISHKYKIFLLYRCGKIHWIFQSKYSGVYIILFDPGKKWLKRDKKGNWLKICIFFPQNNLKYTKLQQKRANPLTINFTRGKNMNFKNIRYFI